MTRTFLLIAAASILCACAHQPPPAMASAANAVYVVPKNTNSAIPAAAQDMKAAQNEAASPGASPMMHIYWFLGGR